MKLKEFTVGNKGIGVEAECGCRAVNIVIDAFGTHDVNKNFTPCSRQHVKADWKKQLLVEAAAAQERWVQRVRADDFERRRQGKDDDRPDDPGFSY
jgi:hypothetical protein